MKKPESSNNIVIVKRVKQFDDGKVVCDLEINGVNIYGCRVVESQKGDFIGFPQYKGKDGNYYSHAYIRLSDDETAAVIRDIEGML